MKRAIIAAAIASSLLLAGCGKAEEREYTHAIVTIDGKAQTIEIVGYERGFGAVAITAANGDVFETGWDNVILTDAED